MRRVQKVYVTVPEKWKREKLAWLKGFMNTRSPDPVMENPYVVSRFKRAFEAGMKEGLRRRANALVRRVK